MEVQFQGVVDDGYARPFALDTDRLIEGEQQIGGEDGEHTAPELGESWRGPGQTYHGAKGLLAAKREIVALLGIDGWPFAFSENIDPEPIGMPVVDGFLHRTLFSFFIGRLGGLFAVSKSFA